MTVERGDGWDLHLGDCREGLDAFDGCDHAIFDAPYSEDVEAGARSGNKNPLHRAPVHFSIRVEDLAAIIAATRARRWSVGFCDWQHLLPLKQHPPEGFRWHQAAIWDKPDGAPRFTGDGPGGGWEAAAILHSTSQRRRWNAGGKHAKWRHGVQKNAIDTIGHPTAKPIPLMEEIVRDFTDPGELICDPFAGSGTTGVACIRLGRRFVGWERDPKYFAIAIKRLRAAREQLQMFEGRP